jgi:phospholipid/cholesterol/gamma-HCH transport system ATP-binding protein
MIELKGVNLIINKKNLLKEINLTIPEDVGTVILGKSGSGKTVLMKTIEGLFKPTSGEILIDGDEVAQNSNGVRHKAFQKVSMLFQNAALLDSFTVFQNIALPMFETNRTNPKVIIEIVNEVLGFVGLQNCFNLYPSELSGGMRKRIGLARALVTNPKYLILDEPTTGLDPITSTEVVSFLKNVIRLKKIIPITVTHDPYCIKELGDYKIIMEEGRTIFSGSTESLEKLTDNTIKNFYHNFFLA